MFLPADEGLHLVAIIGAVGQVLLQVLLAGGGIAPGGGIDVAEHAPGLGVRLLVRRALLERIVGFLVGAVEVACDQLLKGFVAQLGRLGVALGGRRSLVPLGGGLRR